MSETPETIRLLLVDDEAEFLTELGKALSRRGFEIARAPNAWSALQLLAEQSFDVAIVDAKMPGISGVDLFLRLKYLYPGMPVIILTGHGSVQQAFEASRDGVFDYLTKPCEVEKVSEVARRAVREARQVANHTAASGIRLLFVDDDAEFVEQLSIALTKRGMQVTVSATVAEAQRRIESESFDVALLDVKMPGMDGIALLRLVRQAQPLVEVIMLTGHLSIESAVEAVKEGAFDFLMKPFDVESLTGKICEAFGKHLDRLRQTQQEQVECILADRPD